MIARTIGEQLVKFKRATKCTPWQYLEKARTGEIKDTRRNRELVSQAEALSRINYVNEEQGT